MNKTRPRLHYCWSTCVNDGNTQQYKSINHDRNKQHSKMVGCAVNVDMSFAQCWNREYRTVNKTTLLNSVCIVPSHTNVNKQLPVELMVKIFIKIVISWIEFNN